MLKVTQLVSGRAGPQCRLSLTLLSLSWGCLTNESLLSTCCMLAWRRRAGIASKLQWWNWKEVAAKDWEDPGGGGACGRCVGGHFRLSGGGHTCGMPLGPAPQSSQAGVLRGLLLQRDSPPVPLFPSSDDLSFLQEGKVNRGDAGG